MSKKKIQDAYDEIAETYTQTTEQNETPQEQIQITQKFISNLPETGLLLDAGCGSKTTLNHNLKSVGIDFSRQQLEQHTTENYPYALTQGDMTHLPFKDNSFRALTAFYSLIHIPLEDHQHVINEFARVLEPNSYALITEGSDQWQGSNEDWLESDTEMQWEIAGIQKTKQQLRTAGFTIIELKKVPDPTTEDGQKPFYLVQLTD